ncbi:hypothetical protein [Bacillus testis]|uniref:hypothetical protein n=1 Tax=Bacillus testis TaxID=1622072 RepID=UPI00067F43B6|nr:hypothetical protein [Bacillus testis]
MLYIKTKLFDVYEVKIDLYSDEIYTECPDCKMEIQVDSQALISILNDDGDFASTSIYCEKCSDRIIAAMEGGNTNE